jgi:hypothetical protein
VYEPTPIDNSRIRLDAELERLVEPLARNNHELWARRRMAEGWRRGARRDDDARETPLLVPYDSLPESEKEYDRDNARETLKAILALGATIQPPGPALPQPGAGDAPPRFTLEQCRDLAARAAGQGECLTACDLADEGLRHWPADRRLRQLRALALARMGSHPEARRILSELGAEAQDEETLGLLARTYKDLWLESGAAADLERACQAYSDAYSPHRERYWTGINTATLTYARGDLDTARRIAAEVRAVCLAQLDSAPPAERYWITCTLAEAALVSGDIDEAARRYGEASSAGQADTGNLSSTLRNARIVLRHMTAETAARIENAIGMPGIAVFSGHRTDEPGRPRPRFPLSAAADVGSAIRARLVEARVRIGYASAAAGGDILFLEAMQSIGGRTHVVLPSSRAQFLAESVAPCGAEWIPRFERVLENANEVILASEEQLSLGSVAYDYANQVLHGLAVARAAQSGAALLRLAVWDGLPGSPAGTGDVVSRWRSGGHTVHVIEPLSGMLSIAPPDPVPCPPRRHDDSELGSGIRAMIFADAYHFSRLGEAQMPDFIHRFIGLVASLVEQTSPPPVFQNTWGDGLFFVFEEAPAAGRFAIRLAQAVSAMDRRAAGLPETINLRIALHVGPVYRFRDRIIGRPNFIGSHVNRTARIEPITPPGQVYGSHAFAAIAALEAPGEFRCDYVGRIPLAKDFGEFAMYRVQAGDA